MKSEESFRLVILDDDPTGIQTVHGCLLITQWDEATVRMALQHEQPFFYMLTNTRAMTRDEAARVVRSAMEPFPVGNRCDASGASGVWRGGLAPRAFLSGAYRGRSRHRRWCSLHEGWRTADSRFRNGVCAR